MSKKRTALEELKGFADARGYTAAKVDGTPPYNPRYQVRRPGFLPAFTGTRREAEQWLSTKGGDR